MRLATALAVLLVTAPAAFTQVDLKAPWERVEAGNEISLTAVGDTLFIQGEIVGNQDDVEVSTDAGATVTEVDLDDVAGSDVDGVTRVVAFGDRYYVGASGTLFRTTPGDPTSFAVVAATWEGGAPNRIRALFADGDSLVAHGTGSGSGLFSSLDGTTWTRLADADPFATIVGVTEGRILDGGNLTIGAGVSVSTDGGATFERVAAFPDDRYIVPGNVHVMGGGVVWATAWAETPAGEADDTFLYRSLDGGLTWADVSDRLPVGPLAGDTRKDTWRLADGTATRLYVSANPYVNEDAAVFFTDDGAQTWKRVGPAPTALFSGFEVVGGTTLFARAGDHYVSVVSSDAGTGVGRLPVADFTPTDAEGGGGTAATVPPDREWMHVTVAPNPAAGRTVSVQFELATPTAVRVEVFDVLGRRVARVHDGPLTAGPVHVAVESGVLPSGSYFVRVQTERGVASERFVVWR